MPKRIIKFCLPHLNWMTKLILILAIMVMSAVGALMIRLKKGPLDLDFAKERIENALSDEEKGYAVKIGAAQLMWPEVAEPLLINLNHLNIMQGGKSALSIDDFSFSLSGRGLLKGKVLPSQIIINKPAVRIFNEDGSFNRFWQSENKSKARVYGPIKPQNIQENMRDILARLTDPKNSEIKMLSALRKVQIKEAVIQGKKEEGLALLTLSLRKHNLGLEGDLKVTYPEKQGKRAHFKSDILYRRENQDVTFTASLQDLHSSHISPFLKDLDIIERQDLFLSGDVKAAFDKDLNLQLATMNLSMPEGEFVVPDVYETPIPLKDVVFNAQLNSDEKTLDLTNFEATIGGIPVQVKSLARFSGQGIEAPIELKISEIPLENIPAIFPKSHLDSSAGEWLTKKLSKGRLHDIVLTTDFIVSHNPDTKIHDRKMTNVKLTFKGEGLTVQYSETLKPVTDVIAEGVYEDDILTITGKSGRIGDVTGRNIKLKMTDLSVIGGGVADINLDVIGPLKGALDYAAADPIFVTADDLGFDIKNVGGDVKFNLQLNFPTVKDLLKEDVLVKIKGTANNILLPDVVRGLSLTGGPYNLGFDDGAITLKGKGKLGGRDIDLDWRQYLDSTGRDYASRIKASILADAGLRDIFDIGLKDYISGPIAVNVTYLDKGVEEEIDVQGDLTPTTLHIDSFNYRKPPNVSGTLGFKAYLTGGDIKEVDSLKVDTQGFSLSGGRLIFKKFKDGTLDVGQGNIPVVKLGKSQLSAGFEISNDNILKIIAKGSIFDMAPFIASGKKRVKQQPSRDGRVTHISLQSNKMLGAKGEAMADAKLYLELNKQSEPTRIEMDARVGRGNMMLRFKPDSNGNRNFQMRSDDAGYTLKILGLYDKMRGGKMSVSGYPKRGVSGDDLYGTAQINDFTIKKAPALAKLMSAMSLKGVEGLVSNEGVPFSKLASKFEWKFNDVGNLLVLKEGRTSGNELGLTFEGFINMGTDITDISGTVIPLSSVNKVIGQIPLIGDLLTGGDALFAATYSMKGPSGDPKITINPLSVLAPGFLRKILFESDVDKKVKKEEAKK